MFWLGLAIGAALAIAICVIALLTVLFWTTGPLMEDEDA